MNFPKNIQINISFGMYQDKELLSFLRKHIDLALSIDNYEYASGSYASSETTITYVKMDSDA